VVSLAVAVTLGTLVIWRSLRVMRSAAEDVRAEHGFSLVVRPLPPPPNRGFELVSSPDLFLQAARFQDHLYLAGPAGLQEYSPDGTPLHQYTVARELPGSPLVALAPAVLADSREPELIIASASACSPSTAGHFARSCPPTPTPAPSPRSFPYLRDIF
jgi:hypothetical protein